MVLQQRQPSLRRRRGASRTSSSFQVQHILYLLVGITLLAAFLCVFFILPSNNTTNNKRGILRRHYKKLIPETDNVHNSLAQDIITSLECESLQLKQQNIYDNLDDDDDDDDINNNRRRLEQITDDFEPDEGFNGNNNGPLDDDALGEGDEGDFNTQTVNAKHMLCLVAGSKNLPSYINKDAIQCDAMGTKRQALLDVWSSARTQMSLALIQKTLELAQETPSTILDHPINIWMPAQDQSLEFLQNVLNDESSSVRNLPLQNKDSLFIDVGSGLGVTTLAVAQQYPNTHILSVEPASPSWLLQKLNLVCNLPQENDTIEPILSGVGGSTTTTNHKRHHHMDNGMAKVLWRPSMTRLTRTWTSKNETSEDDLELIVRLRTLRSILAEYTAENLAADTTIDTMVLNLDCEGCEYNVVPSMSEKELHSFSQIIGMTGVHWGYIPVDKLPSSKRAATTHERLCKYYDYAKTCIECCAFGELKVIQSGEEEQELTVKQVAGDLCNGFDDFAEKKLLYASNDDYGWTELSSRSEVA